MICHVDGMQTVWAVLIVILRIRTSWFLVMFLYKYKCDGIETSKLLGTVAW